MPSIPSGDRELAFLSAAYEANPKDADLCRQMATALGNRQRFDEAIDFWIRVGQLQPNDEETARAIAALAVRKVMWQYENEAS